MSASSQSSSSSPDNTQAGGVVDPLDLLDFTEYDNMAYQSPSVSPITSSKSQFARNSVVSATSSTMPSSQSMPGPSHQYDQYKQQTPFVPGALASTMAVNQSSSMGYNLDFMANLSPSDDLFDFNATSQAANMDLDFESPEASFFFGEPTITPSATQTLPSPPAVTSNVGRMYPGMHQQAALAKAQAQQRQQQQIIQQQRQQSQPPKQQRSKATPPTDPIVEQKISQLLNSMRSKPSPPEGSVDNSHSSIVRPKKEDDEMDDDERLLASEEGKKLSSKERRQLRNKVSARAFRSRRKEYITQLEAEIATKVTENGDLRAQNRALLDENRRLSDLTRMLLSSPSFSNFLDHLSANPNAVPQQPAPVQQQVQQVEQRESEARQMPKDVNPYAGPSQVQQQQIGMVMIPEQTMDFSMLNLDSDAFNFQPQVFTVLETPEMPEIDTAVLAGKSSSHEVDSFELSHKAEIPAMEAPVLLESAKAQTPESPIASESSEKSVASLDADIFDDEESTTTDSLVDLDLFGGVQPEKALARYELVDASEEEAASARALMRVQRISASLDATMARLERLTAGL